jgi:hypothetical protein
LSFGEEHFRQDKVSLLFVSLFVENSLPRVREEF